MTVAQIPCKTCVHPMDCLANSRCMVVDFNKVSEIKDSNPKDAIGAKKIPYSMIPAQPVAELALAMLEGALKYGRHNYREIGVRYSVYIDAAKRHLDAAWEGQDIDPVSGLPHLIKAMACLTIIRDAEIHGKLFDDRPPAAPDPDWQDKLNIQAEALIAKFPNPKAPFLNRKV